MRKVTLLALVGLMLTGVAKAEDRPLDDGLYHEWQIDYILDGAAKDLQKHRDFYAKIRARTDAATGIAWSAVLGEALPSQPIAVIDIIAMTGNDMGMICPKFFPEGTEEYEIDEWYARSIETLQAFTLVDPKKDAIRKECLSTLLQSTKARSTKK